MTEAKKYTGGCHDRLRRAEIARLGPLV